MENQPRQGNTDKAILWIKRNHLPYTLSAVVCALAYGLFAKEATLAEANRAAGWAALALIAIVMALGPLSRIWPQKFMRYLYVRKPAGIIGAVLAIMHSAYSIAEFYNGDLLLLISYAPVRIAVAFCLISIGILILMTATSTQTAVKIMGYDRWKLLQTTGYIAIFAAAAHAFALNYMAGFSDTRPIEWAIMGIAIAAVAMRAYDHLRQKSQDKKPTT
ncbi:MAG: ferric reductase-like transmembrane domain-containing protein [Candidatus Micrarchaeota archaeon]|nr:ferric reductase-like transmembrane domain-containing protein [Candidatus Micrarchaeota archaeon]